MEGNVSYRSVAKDVDIASMKNLQSSLHIIQFTKHPEDKAVGEECPMTYFHTPVVMSQLYYRGGICLSINKANQFCSAKL